MTEKEIIELILPGLHTNGTVEVPAGDDCSVLKNSLSGNVRTVIKVDTVVEDIHFKPDESARRVGHKALARPLSDFAAMGVAPQAAMISLSIASPADSSWISGFYDGMNELARKFDVAVAGGETTRIPSGKCIAVSVIGFTGPDGYVCRHSVREGDALFVTGSLGGSITGHHLDFIPRIHEGIWLRENFEIHAMMDLSDGLASDLQSMLSRSGLGADLLRSGIPVSRVARERFRDTVGARQPIEAAMADGEDYELLFTVSPSQAVAVKDGWKKSFPDIPITCIGKISPTPGIRLQTEKGFEILRNKGFDHFEKPQDN